MFTITAMKQFILFALLFGLLISCKKDPSSNSVNLKSYGKITGIDARMCPSPCCGGWFIEINKENYRFLKLPDNSNLDLSNATFPVNVYLSWKKIDSGCGGDEISVLSIQKVKASAQTTP